MTLNDFAPLDFKKEGIVIDYKTAGVDIEAGNEFVSALDQGKVCELRPRLAQEAFNHTAEYDTAISTWMGKQ